MKKNIYAAILWGALWGTEEATVGQLLHISALNIGWVLWFPLAWFFMSQVLRRTKSSGAILFTAFISAVIKLVNLLTPIPAQYVICPALSIILEGLAVYAAVKFTNKNSIFRWNRIGGITLINLAWRAVYLAAVLLIPSSIIAVYPYVGIIALASFMFYEGITNSILIYLPILVTAFIRNKSTLFKFIPDKMENIPGVQSPTRSESNFALRNKLNKVFSINKPVFMRVFTFIILTLAIAIQFVI